MREGMPTQMKKRYKNVMNNGIQNMPLQNMAPWHTEDFKLKESEKMTESGRLLLPSCHLSPLKQGILIPGGEEHLYPKTEGL